MEVLALTLGMVLRLIVPAALLLWGCGRIQAWDRRQSVA